MKIKLLVLATVLALTFAFVAVMRPPGVDSVPGQDMPWQIRATADGSIEVFGLTLGESTLADAVAKLGRRYELGLFVEGDGAQNLEAYFRDTVLGGLNARVVATAELEPDVLQALIARAGAAERLPSGAVRYPVAEDDIRTALTAPIASLTYAPHVKLDPDLVNRRFGPPTERIAVDDDVHWLYPDQGLDLIMRDGGRVILQYLPPRDFERVHMPLLSPSQGE